jgi:hypothetical protein
MRWRADAYDSWGRRPEPSRGSRQECEADGQRSGSACGDLDYSSIHSIIHPFWKGAGVWSIRHDWKSCVQQCTVGSNPTPSAKHKGTVDTVPLCSDRRGIPRCRAKWEWMHPLLIRSQPRPLAPSATPRTAPRSSHCLLRHGPHTGCRSGDRSRAGKHGPGSRRP